MISPPKICVSIGRGRHKQMIAEHRHLVEQGAKLVELRLDYVRRAVNLKRLISDRPCPVIITCRRDADGGQWTESEDARLVLLRSAIADGVEYVDLEEDIAGGIPRFGKTRRIVSYHNFRETPDDLHAIHRRMAGLDPDIIKIATMAHHPHDNVRILQLIKSSSIPTVAMCMGDIGTPSRLLAGRFGAPFTYATFHHERSLAPGQLSYRQMTDIYHYESINAETAIYGVVADPIAHSLSPVLHNAAFRELDLKNAYLPFRVPREDLGTFLGDCQDLGIKGLSVTIPHKEEVMQYLDSVDADAAAIGAVNTVVFQGETLLGYNTDHQAAVDSLLSVFDPTGGRAAGLAGKTALILGAGGVSRAIAYGLKQLGADVIICGRSETRAKQLAEKFGCRTVEWESRHRSKPGILVNGTPLGMHPNVDETPIERRYLHRDTIVFDTVYNPEQTLLIKQARETGCRVVTGVDMFVRQAALQFRLFTGLDAPVDLMRHALKATTGAAKY